MALALTAVLLLPACGDLPPLPPPEPGTPSLADGPRRVEILFLGHGSQHHDARELAPLLMAALAPAGINLTYSEDPDSLDPATLALHDGVLLYANHDEITPDQERALLDFVAAGGGFVPLHSASHSFRNSDAFVDLVGAQFLSHGAGWFTTAIVEPSHPVMEGVEPFETWDETYVHHRHNPDRIVVMERVDADGREPWSWVRTHGEGRVFYTAYGHDRRTWEQPMFQRLLRNGILWAVGDDIRALQEALALPTLLHRDPPVPIPDYAGRDEPLRLQEPLSPRESLKHWQVPPGFHLQLFAAEPDIVNPVAMTWDERGRLWLVETVDYPNDIHPDGDGNDVIRILEDTTGDGRADRFTVFADGLSIPTGIVLANGGAIVANAPRFLFLKDTTGDGRADVREEILTGWGTHDTHGGPSNLRYGFDNRIWGVVGSAGFDGMARGGEGAEEPLRFGAGIFRLLPDGTELESVAGFTNNSWGMGFSEAFDVFGSTANNEHSVQVAIPNRYFDGVVGLRGRGQTRLDSHYRIHPLTRDLRQVDYQGGFTSAAGHQLYTARSFPQEYWNRVAFVTEPTGHLVHRAILDPEGAGYRETDGWNLMASADEWASPVHAEVGPDGAVWVLDWYNFIIQHNPAPPGFELGPGLAYETPLRDRQHGRVYRLVWSGAPPDPAMSLDPSRPRELVDALRHHNLFWRMTAQRLLVERGEEAVLPDLYRIARDRSVDEVGLNGPAVNALWTLHGLGALDGGNRQAGRVVRDALLHPSGAVRKNAVMVLPRDRDTFSHIRRAGVLEDSDRSVRLHAFLALADLEPSDEVGRALYELARDDQLLEDPWLPTALFLASRRHADGFLAAYAQEVGALEFARTAGQAYRGELDGGVDWSAPALDDRDWEEFPVPALWSSTALGHFFGVIWFRRELHLPDVGAGDRAVLNLGPITDHDVTYVNGVRVGGLTNQPTTGREYPIPPGVLRAGRNVVAVQVTNQRRGGGMFGEPEQLFVEGPGFRVPLAGGWKHRIAGEWAGGRPPDFLPGVPFAVQFLRFQNPVGNRWAAGTDEVPAPTSRAPVALGVVPGENRFDRDRMQVRPGAEVALAFDNTDDMPHNVVVLERGLTLEAVGGTLDAFVADPSAAARDYIPEGLPVLAASPMVAARESATFVFTAPAQPGEYLFVCTVPGHWSTMWGILIVEE